MKSTLRQRQTLRRIIQILLHARVWILSCKRLWHILILMAAKSIKFTLVTMWLDGEAESLGTGSNRWGIGMIERGRYSGLLEVSNEEKEEDKEWLGLRMWLAGEWDGGARGGSRRKQERGPAYIWHIGFEVPIMTSDWRYSIGSSGMETQIWDDQHIDKALEVIKQIPQRW